MSTPEEPSRPPSRPAGLGCASRELYTALKQWGSVVAWRAGCVSIEKGRRARARALGRATARTVLSAERFEGRWPSPRELASDWQLFARLSPSFPAGILPIADPCVGRMGESGFRRPPKAFCGRPDTCVALGYLTVCRLFREVGGAAGTPFAVQRGLCWLLAVPRYAGTEPCLADWSPGNHEVLEARLDAWCREASRVLRRRCPSDI